jgi:hypothetical protein
MNKFDKPFRTQPLYDNKKIIELFNRVAKLDTYELLQYSLINQISLDVTNNNGDSLIHEIINVDNKKATEKIKLDIIKFLIQNNVNPDLPNQNNKTPLHYACFYQYEKIVEYLLLFNVDTNFQDNYGYTPLHYLFLGNIKTYNNKSNIEDFIPITINNKNNLKDIKKNLWKYINDVKLPLFNLLNETIDNIFDYDNEIKSIKLKYIKYLESINDNSNDLSDIKEKIFLFRNNITIYIKNKFNNFNKSVLLNIHESEPESWKPNLIKSNYSIIKSGDNDKWFKKNLNNIINQIIKNNNLFIPINLGKSVDGEYIFNGMTFNIQHMEHIFKQPAPPPAIQYPIPVEGGLTINKYTHYHLFTQYYPLTYKHIYDELLYINALDYASDIIDVENLTLMGGPREIKICYLSNEYNYNYIYIYQIFRILKALKSNDKKILFLLSSPIDNNNIDFFNNNNIDFFNDDILMLFINDIKHDNAQLWYGYTQLPILHGNKYNIDGIENNNDDKNIYYGCDEHDMIIYILFSYYSIFNNNIMIDLINNKKLKNILYKNIKDHDLLNEPPIIDNNYNFPFCNNFFANKWYNIYINKVMYNKKLLGPWILAMWYDLMSKHSKNNLNCVVPFKLSMLISYLINVDNINVDDDMFKHIINSFKPQLIEYILKHNVKVEEDDDAKKKNIIKCIKYWIIYILDTDIDTTDKNIFDDENHDHDHDYGFLNYNFTNTLLKNIILLFDAIFNNNNIKDNDSFIDIYNIYKNKYNNNNIEILCAIINDYYDKLYYKPLKQTIVDTLFILRKAYFYKYINKDIIKFNNIYNDLLYLNSHNISTLANDNLNFNLDILPSLYGLYNCLYINKYEYKTKFQLSHLLGLYYEGTIQETDLFNNYKYNNHIYLIISPNYNLDGAVDVNYYDYTPMDIYNNHEISRINYFNHVINSRTNNLMDGNIPLPLNYIINEENDGRVHHVIDPNNKTIFYNYYMCINKCYIAPTYKLYCYTILKNINYFQNKINDYLIKINNIILLLNKGDIKNIYKIYTEYYFAIIIITNIIHKYIISLNTVIKNHNKIKDDKYYKIYNNNCIYNYALLAKDLNYINALIYIYTYLFNKNKIIKLSRFNYYQLPENNNTFKYLYYKKDDNKKELDGSSEKYTISPSGEEDAKKSAIVGGAVEDEDEDEDEDKSKFRLGIIGDITVNNHVMESYKTIDNFGFSNIQLYNIKEEIFFIDKQSNLPPSLHNHLEIFYERILIENIKYIINDIIKTNTNNIYTNIKKLIEKKYIQINENEINIIIYHYLSKLIEELFIEKINIIIYQKITILYNKYILNSSKNLNFNINENIINLNESISLFDDNNKDLINKDNDLIKNFYKIINKNDKNYKFILYSNDFSNNKLYRNNTKYYIDINNNLIKLLLDNNANPLLYDFDNASCFSKILKNYYYHVLDELRKNNLKINNLTNDIEYIKSDIINNIEKIINNNETKLNIILKNISENLYNEIENLLYANQEFGNNIVKYLIDGFYLSSYLIFQYLSYKINYNNKINKYYLIKKIDIPNNISYIINEQLSIDVKSTYTNKFVEDTDIIKSYINYFTKLDNLIIIYAWHKLFNEYTLNEDQYNADLIPLYLLQEQYNIIKSNKDIYENINKLIPKCEKLSHLCEQYFNCEKYTDKNEMLDFINNLLIYITKIVIGYNLEYTIKRLLFLYLYNTTIIDDDNKKIKSCNTKIDYIFNNNYEFNKSFKEFIYKIICPLLVKTSVNIYKDKQDEIDSEKKQVKDILKELVDLLDVSPVYIDETFKNNLKKKIVLYFDTFTSNIILLWYVNIENILKYIINNYRSLKTLVLLINH